MLVRAHCTITACFLPHSCGGAVASAATGVTSDSLVGVGNGGVKGWAGTTWETKSCPRPIPPGLQVSVVVAKTRPDGVTLL